MHNKFYTPRSVRISSRLNTFLKENFGYELKGEIAQLRQARIELKEMMDRNEGSTVENAMMIHTIEALIKAHGEELVEKSMKDSKPKAKKKIKESSKEREYTCVHVKKGKTTVKANTSYEAAKKAADKWKLKSTSGIDAHLHTEEPKAMTEKKGAKMNESQLQNSLLKELNSLLENDAASAEITMAARGIVDELQDVIEKLGKIQNDQLGPLVDQMSYTHGRDGAEAFRNSVNGSVSDLLDSARSAKDAVNGAVLVLTGESAPEDDMMGGEEVVGGDMSDDFTSDVSADMDPNAGDITNSGPVDEPLGRAKR